MAEKREVKFTRKIARQIAQNQINHILAGYVGDMDQDYSLTDDISAFEDNFAEDLNDLGLKSFGDRIEIIKEIFEDLREKTKLKISNLIK